MNDIISTYTRQQAIEDGIFVDVSAVAKKCGFTIPVAITTNLFNKYIKQNNPLETETQIYHYLHKIRNAILNDPKRDTDSLLYLQLSTPNDHIDVWVAIEAQSPTDPSPAINIMLPEDW